MPGQDTFQKELRILDILNHSFVVIKGNIKVIFSILFYIYLPLYTVLWFFRFSLNTYSIVFNVLDFFVSTFTVIMITYFTANSLLAKKPNCMSNLCKLALKKYPFVILIILMLYILTLVFSVILIVPGLIFFMFSSFSVYVVVLNKKKLLTAIRYSWEIVKGSFWKVFLFKLFFLIPVLSNILAVYLFTKALFGIQNHVASIFVGLFNEFLIILVLVIDIVLYINLEQVRAARKAETSILKDQRNDMEFETDIELKPLDKYKKPDYPMKDELNPKNWLTANAFRKWSIPKYIYAIIIMISLALASWKEMHYKLEDMETYKKTFEDNNTQLGSVYKLEYFLTSGMGVYSPSLDEMMEESKMLLSNVFFIENCQSISKAYWIIHAMPDGELKHKIQELIRIYDLRPW